MMLEVFIIDRGDIRPDFRRSQVIGLLVTEHNGIPIMGIGAKQCDTGPPVLRIAASTAEREQIFGRAVPFGIEPVEFRPARITPVAIGLHGPIEPQFHRGAVAANRHVDLHQSRRRLGVIRLKFPCLFACLLGQGEALLERLEAAGRYTRGKSLRAGFPPVMPCKTLCHAL
jgi:hypothetical protein